MAAINSIDDNAVPDVKADDIFGPAVYKLYRAGILTGSDKAGTFYPNSYILRKEVAAIASRMVNTGLRKEISLSSSAALSAEDLFLKCSPAVFCLEVYDKSDNRLGSGSGFFISSTGVAITNYHIIEGASKARISTSSGQQYDVKGVYDYSKTLDLALIQIDGADFPYLEIGDPGSLSTGATVYAIGNPLGLENTLSVGIVSNANRILDGSKFIQITAPISPGSNGGALLDTYGKVIGITSAALVDGQNLNLAIPIDLMTNLSQNNGLSQLSSLLHAVELLFDISSVNLEQGGESDVIVSFNTYDFGSIQFTVEDPAIASGLWGEWIDYTSLPLTVFGLKPGATSILVELLDDDWNVLASSAFSVNVTAGQTAYYEYFYPVPDYGAFTDAPVYETFDDHISTLYYYSVTDLPEDPASTIDGYNDLLLENGFEFSSSFQNDEGFMIMVYTNSLYSIDVYIGMENLNDIPCLYIRIIPR